MDPTRVAIWGASAGAHLAALAAFDSPLPVRALVGWFGAYDLSTLLADASYPDIAAAAGKLLGCAPAECSRAVSQAASPLARLGRRAPASLLIHGDDDRVVPPAQSVAMAEALRRQGAEVGLVLIPAVGHGLVGSELAVTRAANRRALEANVTFLDRTLQGREE
ncbi:hypothetical protein DNK06_02565 [Pseudomonas daroniae]|uniref:Peptidase S9 prolyl oligopeptidase catalytic domain-containing protein n=1 Tax=Phytopseudomonas daroniae TaxID=2487519 RepID=A0A4Q9QS24_9GAMM|nr:hypothetical protein DNK10_06330 [Pseudomonas daroniae]TBU83340.1 hypothetical protein DNK06_02565 [Pseudomonas daroniae]TBU84979.1 hypothetical protein DNK31_04945 [Pseudomonas sp. FRB 228]TBU93728.1 hypothetical protein DNJ99_05125 [Pseudomonas daroniae]